MTGDLRQPAHRLVTDLMRHLVQGDISIACEILSANKSDIEVIFQVLERSRLSGYFYSLIVDTPMTAIVAAETLEQLATSHRRQVEANRNSLELLKQIQQALNSASIPFLTLKGLYLAQRFFGDASRRFMWDIDILVHPEDLDGAVIAMESIGLRLPPGVNIDPMNPLWRIHAVEVRGESGKLDIHCAIRKLSKVTFNYEKIWRNSHDFSIGDARFSTLCDEDTLLSAAVGLGTDIQNSHHNLRKIWDIYMMLRELDAPTDWEAFFAERDGQGSLKLVINVFAFCLHLVGAKQDCPNLIKAMQHHRRRVLVVNERQARAIFARGRQNIANRILFSRLLPISALRYWLGWAVTLPVRVWHYR